MSRLSTPGRRVGLGEGIMLVEWIIVIRGTEERRGLLHCFTASVCTCCVSMELEEDSSPHLTLEVTKRRSFTVLYCTVLYYNMMIINCTVLHCTVL